MEYNFPKFHLKVWRHHWALWERQHAFGCQKLSYQVEILHTGWRPLVLQHRYIPFLFFILWLFFQKRWFFENFRLKPQILQIRDSHFVDLAILCIIHLLFAFPLKTIFLWNLKHLSLIDSKSREVASQNSNYKKSGLFWFFAWKYAKLRPRRGMPSFMSIQ